MKRLTLLIPILMIGIFLTSCESQKHISVTVIDKNTGQPLDSVLVKINAGKKGNYNMSTAEGYTDPNGKFETDIMIGCTFGCYDIYSEYNKKGYTKKTEFNKTEGKVELEQ